MPQKAKKIISDEVEAGFVRIEKLLEETAKVLKESQEKTEIALEKYIKENNKAIMEAKEDTRKLKAYLKKTIKALNVSVGGLNNTMGNMTESILVPSLVNKFNRMGFTFQNMNRRRKIESDKHEVITEVDAILENATQAMAVEVKTTLKRDEVDHHAERMEKIRRDADAHNDKRQYFAAMAAAVVDDETKRYALNQGFYLIEPLGDDVTIIEPSKARVW